MGQDIVGVGGKGVGVLVRVGEGDGVGVLAGVGEGDGVRVRIGILVGGTGVSVGGIGVKVGGGVTIASSFSAERAQRKPMKSSRVPGKLP
jgi:hypothetical protein